MNLHQNESVKNFWLLKTEPDTFSIDDLQKKKREPWTGVRNYQARNFMRDQMSVGDLCFFYHSSCEVPAIVGICKISKINLVDKTQFDKKSEYFDSKSKQDNPTWICVEVEFVEKFKKPITLQFLRSTMENGIKKDKNFVLKNMRLLQPGSRLSVQPVTREEFDFVIKLVEKVV